MTKYKIFFSKKAHTSLFQFNQKQINKILNEISDLENFPFLILQHDMAKLKGKKNYYRFRIGDIRVIFRIDKSNRKIFVDKVDMRKSVYKK